MRIEQKISEQLATNIICFQTKRPIFAEEGCYLLNHEWYCEDVDIDKEIREVTGGEYKNMEALYEDGSDFVYWTTNYDEEAVLNEITDQGYYYDQHGNKVEL